MLRVLQAGDGLGLAAEPVAVARPGVAAGQDHLQRDRRGSGSTCRAL